MSKGNKMNRGFSYIEVIVSLTILIIIGGTVASFFVSQMKSMNCSINSVEIQYQGQMGMNELSQYIMKTKRIVKIQNGVQDLLNDGNETKVTKAVFLLNTGKYLIIKHTINTAGIKVLRINTNGKWEFSSANAEFIDYIESMKMKPESNTFKECSSIILTMTFEKGEEQITLSNQVCFRNAEDR